MRTSRKPRKIAWYHSGVNVVSMWCHNGVTVVRYVKGRDVRCEIIRCEAPKERWTGDRYGVKIK